MEVSGHTYAPVALPPGKRASGTHWIGSWVGLRAGLYAMERRNLTPALQSVARRYTDRAIRALDRVTRDLLSFVQ
jgi:hypothetical protein